MVYTLLNKRLNRRLTHPAIGVWYTDSIEEARSMLRACHEYLDASKMSIIKSDFVVIEMETGKEIDENVQL